MSIGTGIFLSALFLGCIVLYVKSENKAKWRKGILFSLAGLVAAGVILFVGSSVYDAFEDDTPTSPFPKNTAERPTDMMDIRLLSDEVLMAIAADRPTDMMGIRLGETLATLQFERGKFWQIKGQEIYNSTSTDEYAKWIVENADKKGSPEFEIIAKKYRLALFLEIGGFQNEVQHFIRDWNDGLFYG